MTQAAVTPRLILASASPRRKELLAQLGLPFAVIPAEVVEHEAPDADPREMVSYNAALKADWVAARHPEATVIGADTTVFVGKTVLNKPRDAADARAMLRRLSGSRHTVFTGLAIRRVKDRLKLDGGAASEVTFKQFDDATIELYLSRVHTLDKAGGYAIQEHSELIVESFTGSLTNIIGMPLEEMKQLLTRAGLLG
ncbi:Maf family protein [Oleiharenicola lentus]|uniref:Maf family protein n=1 Tax=Oleiharenicola lentus TaxID=2508720 RepID=UPI003F6684B4